jgi:hypothetical protein
MMSEESENGESKGDKEGEAVTDEARIGLRSGFNLHTDVGHCGVGQESC